MLVENKENKRLGNVSLEVAFRILDRLNQHGSHKRTTLASYSGLNYDVGTKYFENMCLLDWVEMTKVNEFILIKTTQEGTRVWKKICEHKN